MKFSCHFTKMYQYLYLIFILICSISANDLNDQDDYSQSINNYDLSSLNTTQNQNVIDLIQTIQLNSTHQLDNKNLTGLNTNLTSSNIPILFNQYQYDQSPIYLETSKDKEQFNGALTSSSSSSQSTFLDSSGTNQNYLSKDYNNNFDDSQKMYIEQQIEQDNKYMPEIYNPLPPSSSLPAQIIEPPSNENQISQINLNDYGTKINKITKPVQNSNRQPTITKLNKYPVKGSVNSIKMANNQEWNVIDKNTQSGYINIGLNNNLDSSKFKNIYQSNQDDGFTSFDQQYDLTKINKIKSSNQQSNYNRPIDDSTQIITSNNQQTSFQPIQQQIISSNYPATSLNQQTISHQYNSLPNNYQQSQQNYKKPPCSKNNHNINSNSNFNRQRPFYFGWKQQQQHSQPQRQKVAINNAMNYIQQQQQQQQNYQQQNSYQKNNYQTNQNKYFGMPNHFDQQSHLNGGVKKCCIVKLVRKPNGFNNRPSASAFMTNQQMIPFPSSSMMNFNPFQSGMFGGLGGGFVNKLENKKSKIKNLIKAPFIFVNDIKHKALGGGGGGGNVNNNYKMRNPNFNYYPMQQQQQQQSYPTKTSYSQAYNY